MDIIVIKFNLETAKTKISNNLFNLMSKQTSDLVSKKLTLYVKSTEAVEMVQTLVNRYDEAIETITKLMKMNKNSQDHLKSQVDISLERITNLSNLLKDFQKETKDILTQLNKKTPPNVWKTEVLSVSTSFSRYRVDGKFFAFTIKDELTPASVNECVKVHLDGILLMHGSDYSIEPSETSVTFQFAEDLRKDSIVVLELLKDI